MRVVAGRAKGRLLRAPTGRATRPTSDRVREAMFDILASLSDLDGASVVDLFAGSGALGVEALSRGARSAVFVDAERTAIDAVRANLAVLDQAGAAGTVVRADAVAWARRAAARGDAFDVVFADPPYAWSAWPSLLDPLVAVAGLVVAETGTPLDPGSAWETVRSRRYGSTVVTMVRPLTSDVGTKKPTPAPAWRDPAKGSR